MDDHPPRALVQPEVDEVQQLLNARSGFCGNGDHILAPGQNFPAGEIALVEYLNLGQVAGAQLPDQLLHDLSLLLPLGVGHVDDVEQKIRVFQLLQSGLKRLHKLVGKFPDKAHGVAENHVLRVTDG
ncbi:hypothetical protein SDC9_165034 [bioreactor metagenome]|uniref:Uncharacterized protein n=1 Tax=bioreactor metagenome TaxID=1076179 RepID=A0A645FVV4_9ZZZZ